MPRTTKSFATKDGKAYFKNTGRYNEFTKTAKNKFRNDAPSSMRQRNLAQSGKHTGAALSANNVKRELGL